jgi:hypothetical protein
MRKIIALKFGLLRNFQKLIRVNSRPKLRKFGQSCHPARVDPAFARPLFAKKMLGALMAWRPWLVLGAQRI